MKKATLILSIIAIAVLRGSVCEAQTPGVINTIAGDGTAAFAGDDGLATKASLNMPSSIAIDGSGNIYIADEFNQRIRKINTAGIITTIAGTGAFGGPCGDGPATAAKLGDPFGVALDDTGNLYIADLLDQQIRKINTAGIIDTFAGSVEGSIGDGGPATAAQFAYPNSVAVDDSNNVYVTDNVNNTIRKINTSGIIYTIAGMTSGSGSFSGDDGPATAAMLNGPSGVAVDKKGNIYIADELNHRIRKVGTNGIITTFAGGDTAAYSDGALATAIGLGDPVGVATDASGNVYISDQNANIVTKVNSAGIITTVAGITDSANYKGDGGPATAAVLNMPYGITIDNNGNIYIADRGNSVIRKINGTPSSVGTVSPTPDCEVYPNPVTDMLTIKSEMGAFNSFTIINTLGEVLIRQVITANETEVSVKSLPAGIYAITLNGANGAVVKKFVKR